ncbi:MAG: ribosomal protein S18-alanine N-acetyltransferase [Acidobacteria bacterium]|nr:ribosomal protein S18-alanine N-acetyltransferase [Acidobacteriota bacterium]
MRYTLGPLVPDRDLDDVVAIEALSFPHPWSKAMVLSAVAPSARGHAYVARSVTGVMAYCVGQLVVDELHIHTFAVHPTVRQCGLGGRLLRTVLHEAESGGVTSSTLEVRRSNVAAQRLYERAGFTRTAVRPGYYRTPTEDALIYWRRSPHRDAVRPA